MNTEILCKNILLKSPKAAWNSTRFRLGCMLLSTILGSVALVGQGPKPMARKPVSKSEEGSSTPATTPAGTHDMTPEDVSAFLDGIMPQQLARTDEPCGWQEQRPERRRTFRPVEQVGNREARGQQRDEIHDHNAARVARDPAEGPRGKQSH